MKKKLTLVVSLLLVMALSIGGTLAYLTDTTDAITNTFTVGNVKIALAETTGDDYKIVPGDEVDKNPTITVEEDSEDCYVYAFIDNTLILDNEVVAIPNVDTTVWTAVKVDVLGKSLYRYNEVLSAGDTAAIFTKVAYDGEAITAENIGNLNEGTITVTAFAHQADNIDNVTVADEAAIAQFFPAEEGGEG